MKLCEKRAYNRGWQRGLVAGLKRANVTTPQPTAQPKPPVDPEVVNSLVMNAGQYLQVCTDLLRLNK